MWRHDFRRNVHRVAFASRERYATMYVGVYDFDFEELGPLNLKNIFRPVEAFVLRSEGPATPSLLLARTDDTALPLPGKPSIAVLAFTNMSGDVEQEYFSDGIADDIIIELSRDHTLFCHRPQFQLYLQGALR